MMGGKWILIALTATDGADKKRSIRMYVVVGQQNRSKPKSNATLYYIHGIVHRLHTFPRCCAAAGVLSCG